MTPIPVNPNVVTVASSDSLIVEMATRNIPIRFSVRSLLLLVLVSSISIVATQRYLATRNSMPMAFVLKKFNNQHHDQYKQISGNTQPALTSEFLIEYLKSEEDSITQAPPRAIEIFREIVRTNRIPNTVHFYFLPATTVGVGDAVYSWVIGMEIEEKDLIYNVILKEYEE